MLDIIAFNDMKRNIENKNNKYKKLTITTKSFMEIIDTQNKIHNMLPPKVVDPNDWFETFDKLLMNLFEEIHEEIEAKKYFLDYTKQNCDRSAEIKLLDELANEFIDIFMYLGSIIAFLSYDKNIKAFNLECLINDYKTKFKTSLDILLNDTMKTDIDVLQINNIPLSKLEKYSLESESTNEFEMSMIDDLLRCRREYPNRKWHKKHVWITYDEQKEIKEKIIDICFRYMLCILDILSSKIIPDTEKLVSMILKKQERALNFKNNL